MDMPLLAASRRTLALGNCACDRGCKSAHWVRVCTDSTHSVRRWCAGGIRSLRVHPAEVVERGSERLIAAAGNRSPAGDVAVTAERSDACLGALGGAR